MEKTLVECTWFHKGKIFGAGGLFKYIFLVLPPKDLEYEGKTKCKLSMSDNRFLAHNVLFNNI